MTFCNTSCVLVTLQFPSTAFLQTQHSVENLEVFVFYLLNLVQPASSCER